jgi:SET domain-containing protein
MNSNFFIDATARGGLARFVNHSCSPNCVILVWQVLGEPRAGLFAGPAGIQFDEELNFDYNFTPFSKGQLQPCHCGTQACRGFVGPKRGNSKRCSTKREHLAPRNEDESSLE